MIGLVPAILGLVGGLADKLIPDPNARAEFMSKLYSQLQQSDLAQLDVNKAEAAHASIFVAGWRPFIGWVCGAAMVYQCVFLPVGTFVASIFSAETATLLLNAPRLDSNLWELLTAMLGMGALRSFEKLKGVAAK